MPLSNLRILFFGVLICLFCASRATYRDWVLLDAMHRIEKEALYKPQDAHGFDELLFESAINGMISLLYSEGDQYSQYVPENEMKDFQKEVSARYEGIGVSFRHDTVEKKFIVFFTFVDSPAWRAGLRHGDTLLAVDGEEVAGLEFSEVASRIRGEPNTEVTLTVLQRSRTEPVNIPVKRASLQPQSILGDTLREDGSSRFTLETEPDIAYLNLTSSFIETTADEMKKIIRSLPSDVRGMILDLRDNPGGFLDISVNVADMFVKATEQHRDIVTTQRRDHSTKSRYPASSQTLFDLPMVVLIDKGSASASEILAACLQDFGRAKIVGTRSYGKGTVQEMFFLPRGYGILKLTDASYWRPSGKNIQRIGDAPESEEWGVTPDEGCVVPISKKQRMATQYIRRFRSYIPNADAGEAVREARRELEILTAEQNTTRQPAGDTLSPEEPDDDVAEDDQAVAEEPSPEPFEIQGTAPYYDPQLDRAIEELRRMIHP